jgi:hypothetical protein
VSEAVAISARAQATLLMLLSAAAASVDAISYLGYVIGAAGGGITLLALSQWVSVLLPTATLTVTCATAALLLRRRAPGRCDDSRDGSRSHGPHGHGCFTRQTDSSVSSRTFRHS